MWWKVKRMQSAKDKLLWVLALFFALPCMGLGIEQETQIESLVGVQGVQVGIKIGLSQDGPIKQGLQEQIENQLRDAGLRVLEPVKDDSNSYQPSLLIEVSILKSGKKPYVFFVYTNFYQPVRLVNGNSSETLGATWQAGLVGEGGLDHIHEEVAKIVKRFLKHHKMANREKSHAPSD